MPNQGWFDKEATPSGWFVVEASAPGWFDSVLLGTTSTLPVEARVFWVQLEVPAGSVLTPARALYWTGNSIAEVTDALVGTGLKAIVLLNGVIKERSTTEGDPLILLNGELFVLPAGYELII